MKMRTCHYWICYSWIYCWIFLPSSTTSALEREPVILESPVNTSTFVDRSLTLTCEVDGYPMPNVFWQKRENSTGRWQQIQRLQRFRMKQGTFTIKRLLIGDTGFYRCSAENTKGSAYSGAVYLNVQAPVTFVSSPKNHTVNWGTHVELQCEVIGFPLPHRWWTKNGLTIMYDEAEYTEPRLPVNATETATYECLAENWHSEGHTNVSRAAVVTVIDGYCGPYPGETCKKFLGSRPIYLTRSRPKAIERLENNINRLLDELEGASESCRNHSLNVLCLYTYPECIGTRKEARPKHLCWETCSAMKDLYCGVEWQKIEDERKLVIPDCDSLPRQSNTSTTCAYVDLFDITQDKITTSCYDRDGRYYRGTVNVTEGGLECQAWNQQKPNQHSHLPFVYPILEDSGNACRNAGGERERPWCYTMNMSVRWQFCDVSKCDVVDPTTSSTDPVLSAFNIEMGFIVAVVTAIPLTFAILIAFICLRIVVPVVRRPQRDISPDIDISALPPPLLNAEAECSSGSPLEHLEYRQRNSIAHQRDIAQGAFGHVFLADAPKIIKGQEFTTVVVKMLRSDATPDMEQDFVREASILSNFKHQNILQILGVCLVGKPWCVLLEYMPNGDLNEFLNNCSPEHFIVRRRSKDPYGYDVPRLTCAEQLKIARQIAAGMLYIWELGYIHRDLATRNCLVGEELVVKISDFGLAVFLPPDEEFHQGGEYEPIPIRWMPIESIVYNKFTPASDVWSFGIVLWEIFSFGTRPYYDLTQEEVVRFVREGNVLYCPDNTPSDVYELMRICWNQDPQSRPKFDELYRLLCDLETREMQSDIGITGH